MEPITALDLARARIRPDPDPLTVRDRLELIELSRRVARDRRRAREAALARLGAWLAGHIAPIRAAWRAT